MRFIAKWGRLNFSISLVDLILSIEPPASIENYILAHKRVNCEHLSQLFAENRSEFKNINEIFYPINTNDLYMMNMFYPEYKFTRPIIKEDKIIIDNISHYSIALFPYFLRIEKAIRNDSFFEPYIINILFVRDMITLLQMFGCARTQKIEFYIGEENRVIYSAKRLILYSTDGLIRENLLNRFDRITKCL